MILALCIYILPYCFCVPSMCDYSACHNLEAKVAIYARLSSITHWQDIAGDTVRWGACITQSRLTNNVSCYTMTWVKWLRKLGLWNRVNAKIVHVVKDEVQKKIRLTKYYQYSYENQHSNIRSCCLIWYDYYMKEMNDTLCIKYNIMYIF